MRAGDGMLRVQVHDAGPASRTGQAGTAGLDEQDIPGGGDGGWPLRLDDPVFFEPFAPHFHPVLGRAIARVTGELADLAQATAAQAAAVLRNGRRALPRTLTGRMRGRLRQALAELAVRPPSSRTCMS